MKVALISAFSFIVISTVVLISGCSNSTNSPTTPTTGTVTGKVVDAQGNPVSGVTVVINTTSIVTGTDGSFTVNSVTTPYNAKLVTTSGTPTGIYYQGLTTFSPQFYAVGLTPNPSSSTLTVNIPPLLAFQKATVIFTDNALVHSATTVSSSPANVNVTWQNSAPITGKVIVLFYTVDVTGNIVSYDKYGERSNISLNNGGTATQTFAASDLNVTPSTSTLTGTTTIPTSPGTFTPAITRLVLKFTTQGTSLIGVNIGSPAVGSNFTFKVPGGLTTTPTIGLEASSTAPTGELTLKLVTGTVGGSNNITLETPVVQGTPVSGATGVDTTTSFSFNGGTGTGVYIVQLNSTAAPIKHFYIFTTSTSLTIPSFSAYGLPLGTNAAYSWDVIKIGNMSTVDAFVSSGLYNNTNFSFESVSQTWPFTSHP